MSKSGDRRPGASALDGVGRSVAEGSGSGGADPEPPAPATEGIDCDTVDLRSFDLSSDHERVLALVCFYHQWEDALIPFTAHVWDSLTEPRAAKVGAMAQVLGITGTGKAALRKVLDCYLQTTDAAVAATHDPTDEFDMAKGLETLMELATEYFEVLDNIVEQYARRWSRLINGEPMVPEVPPTGEVIEGPWLDLT